MICASVSCAKRAQYGHWKSENSSNLTGAFGSPAALSLAWGRATDSTVLIPPTGVTLGMITYVRMARPDHWVKNLFVLPGTVAALVMLKAPLLLLVWPLVLAMASVCLISSAGYVIN